MSLLVMVVGVGTAFAAARAILERSALELVDHEVGPRADVAVIALDDPELLLETIEEFEELDPTSRPPRCVVMAPLTSGELLVTAIAAGADGWVLPDIPPAAFVRTIEGIHAGESGFSRTDTVHLVAALRERSRSDPAPGTATPAAPVLLGEPDLLTARERQVHTAYRTGETPSQIAQRLQVSHSTVRWHLARINKKLAAGTGRTGTLLRSPLPPAPSDPTRADPARSTDGPSRLVRSSLADLGRAELRVALLVAEGMSNREVAEHLFLSRHTVESHLKSIFAKTHVRSRVELTRLALRASAEQLHPDGDTPVQSLPA